MPHGKGSFAVQVNKAHGKGIIAVQENMAHGIVTVHGRGGRLCRGLYLCRALSSAFVVPHFFAVRFDSSLPCVARCRVFCGAFAVRYIIVVYSFFVTRQKNLCRARTHGRVCQHGS
jgi:hypothetical protein